MKKIVYSIVTFLVCCFTFSSCALFNINTSSENGDDYEGRYTHPDFVTQYTSEEHVERISARTEELFEEELKNGTLVDYQVEIVYAFYDDDPEYFLVTLEYAEEMDCRDGYMLRDEVYGKSKYKYIIGYISYDEYMVDGDRSGINSYTYWQRFFGGKSPYELCGLEYSKKYYGNYGPAVQVGNDIVLLCECKECTIGISDHEIVKGIVSPDRYEEMMNVRFWRFMSRYSRTGE